MKLAIYVHVRPPAGARESCYPPPRGVQNWAVAIQNAQSHALTVASIDTGAFDDGFGLVELSVDAGR